MSNYFLHYVQKNVGMLPKCYILEKTFNWKVACEQALIFVVIIGVARAASVASRRGVWHEK